MGILDWIMGSEPLRDATGTYTKPYDRPVTGGPAFERNGRGTAPAMPALRNATGTYTAPYDVVPRPKPRPELQGPPMPPAAAAPQRAGLGGFLGGFFGPDGRDMRQRLAIGLEGMTLNPNEALIQSIQQDISDRKGDKAKNRTVEWLRSLGTDQAMQAAAALEAGSIDPSTAVQFALKSKDPVNGVEVNGKLINPETGEEIYGGDAAGGTLTDEQMSNLNTLRDDLNTATSQFQIVKSGYDNVQAFFDNPGGVSDYALAVGFAKIVDPGSVAREGEVAAVANAGGQFPSLQAALQNAVLGRGALPPAVREEILRLSKSIYTNKAREAQKTIDRFSETARRGGLPADLLWMNGDITMPPPDPPRNPSPPTSTTFTPGR